MVGWHNYVGNAARRNFYTDDANVIAFSRGSRGWAAFNNGTEDKTIRVQTGMAPGRYRDAILGSIITVTSPGSQQSSSEPATPSLSIAPTAPDPADRLTERGIPTVGMPRSAWFQDRRHSDHD